MRSKPPLPAVSQPASSGASKVANRNRSRRNGRNPQSRCFRLWTCRAAARRNRSPLFRPVSLPPSGPCVFYERLRGVGDRLGQTAFLQISVETETGVLFLNDFAPAG